MPRKTLSQLLYLCTNYIAEIIGTYDTGNRWPFFASVEATKARCEPDASALHLLFLLFAVFSVREGALAYAEDQGRRENERSVWVGGGGNWAAGSGASVSVREMRDIPTPYGRSEQRKEPEGPRSSGRPSVEAGPAENLYAATVAEFPSCRSPSAAVRKSPSRFP